MANIIKIMKPYLVYAKRTLGLLTARALLGIIFVFFSTSTVQNSFAMFQQAIVPFNIAFIAIGVFVLIIATLSSIIEKYANFECSKFIQLAVGIVFQPMKIWVPDVASTYMYFSGVYIGILIEIQTIHNILMLCMFIFGAIILENLAQNIAVRLG